MPFFTTTNYPVGALIEDIDLGKIGLPEPQSLFVWPNVNVRNLFDSLYRGYNSGWVGCQMLSGISVIGPKSTLAARFDLNGASSGNPCGV